MYINFFFLLLLLNRGVHVFLWSARTQIKWNKKQNKWKRNKRKRTAAHNNLLHVYVYIIIHFAILKLFTIYNRTVKLCVWWRRKTMCDAKITYNLLLLSFYFFRFSFWLISNHAKYLYLLQSKGRKKLRRNFQKIKNKIRLFSNILTLIKKINEFLSIY